LIGAEVGGAGSEGVFGEADRGDETVGGGDEELAVGEFVVEEAVGDGADVAGGGADRGVDWDGGSGKVAGERGTVGRSGAIDKSREGGGAAIISETGRDGNAGAADFGVGLFNVLVGEKAEEFVLDDGATDGCASGVTMKAGDFVGGGDVGVGVVEERGGVESVGAAIEVRAAVEIVGARSGAHVDVGAAGGTLLGVVHGSVDAKFFDGFGGGRGESLADGEVGRSGALKRFGCRA